MAGGVEVHNFQVGDPALSLGVARGDDHGAFVVLLVGVLVVLGVGTALEVHFLEHGAKEAEELAVGQELHAVLLEWVEHHVDKVFSDDGLHLSGVEVESLLPEHDEGGVDLGLGETSEQVALLNESLLVVIVRNLAVLLPVHAVLELVLEDVVVDGAAHGDLLLGHVVTRLAVLHLVLHQREEKDNQNKGGPANEGTEVGVAGHT